jgi:hypothetical protein
MTAQENYNSLDASLRRELLLKVGEASESAKLLGKRDYVELGGWVKTRLKKHWKTHQGR